MLMSASRHSGRELAEETQYSRAHVQMLRQGLPLDVDHKGRYFRVHPYLFEVLPDAGS
jgi:biotin operon repressor